MLKRYNDFLLESLITESIVVYSDKFRQILSKIDSPVSKALLDIESKDLDIDKNYIDIAKDKEHFSFIPDNRIRRIMNPSSKFIKFQPSEYVKISWVKVIFEALECDPDYVPNFLGSDIVSMSGRKYIGPVNTNINLYGEVIKEAYVFDPEIEQPAVYYKINILDYVVNGENMKGGILILGKRSVQEVSPTEVIDSISLGKSRQEVRIGRGIQSLLNVTGKEFKQAEKERFVDSYRAEFDRMNDIFSQFELVRGEDIKKWYLEDNYSERSKGTLSNSCMRYSRCQEYFNIYTQNPDVCGLLILRSYENPDKIKGRALVWDLKRPVGITFVDRVYTHDGSDLNLFKEYAKMKGWYKKWTDDYSTDGSSFSPSGDHINLGVLEVKIKSLEEYNYGRYPYLDTFCFFDTVEGLLTTKESRGDDIWKLRETGGGYADTSTCETCDGDRQVNCSDCDGYGTYECPECEGNGEQDCPECRVWSRFSYVSTGKIECPSCDGDGNFECDSCNGEGKITNEEGEEVECEDCDGKGTNDCVDCDGEGKVKCNECDGDETLTCNRCEGDGVINCRTCGGEGMVDCPDCN